MSQYDVKPGRYGPPTTVPPFELDLDKEGGPDIDRLEGLLADLETAVAVSKEAQANEKRIKDDIKSEVTGLVPGRERILILSQFLSKPWMVRAQESWSLDSKMLKADEPLIWVKYAYKKTAWYLEVAKGVGG